MNGIFWEGRFEESFIPIILHEIYEDKVYELFVEGRTDMVIVDAGANIGLTAMYFSQFASRVVAIEPCFNHIVCLREMARHNGLKNIESLRAALSDQDGFAPLSESPGNQTMTTITPGEE